MAPPLDFHWKRSWRAGPFGWALDVLLVSLTTDVGEISALLASAGHRIVDTTIQRRDRPDSRTFVGRGKLDEVQARVDGGGIDAVVFNGELRPTMHYQLERDLGVECYDRLRVLLNSSRNARRVGRENSRSSSPSFSTRCPSSENGSMKPTSESGPGSWRAASSASTRTTKR